MNRIEIESLFDVLRRDPTINIRDYERQGRNGRPILTPAPQDPSYKSYGHGGMLPVDEPKPKPHGDPTHLVGNPDAEAWAEAFCIRNPAINYELIFTWFANAIVAGKIAEQARQKEEDERKRTELQRAMTDSIREALKRGELRPYYARGGIIKSGLQHHIVGEHTSNANDHRKQFP